MLNPLYIAALQLLGSENEDNPNVKVFAFNDYMDKKAVDLPKEALKDSKGVKAVSKASLFNDGKMSGALGYRPVPGTENALLVSHKNSDAFGQKIDYGGAAGFMDGALGAANSAAACLARERMDLVSGLCKVLGSERCSGRWSES